MWRRNLILLLGLPLKALIQVCRISSVRVLPPHTVVVYAGEIFRKMYIVQRGYCHVFSGATGELIDVVSPGGRFYVLEMMLGICGVHTVVTDTHCTVICISFAKFMKVLSTHPEYRKDLRKIIEKMHARVKTIQEFHIERHAKPKYEERKQVFRSFCNYKSEMEFEPEKMGLESVARRILQSWWSINTAKCLPLTPHKLYVMCSSLTV
ncbi:uncharacterized protein LOC124795333 isoform X2 [Schistocerca piceifrons]|uniref:uncharacterized protein LOC124795333 isoform X2 n=1 Tax=Schistocerca piceifrons TaxID=274613 RepID=UPI001F5EA5D8|nr:uncharacterized protein LOC124795333 isoform X2 [Schistocerca piceifrons]